MNHQDRQHALPSAQARVCDGLPPPPKAIGSLKPSPSSHAHAVHTRCGASMAAHGNPDGGRPTHTPLQRARERLAGWLAHARLLHRRAHHGRFARGGFVGTGLGGTGLGGLI